ncbi:hypothetical protein Q0Z83_060080 [Actinoplanes sichuanensis]|uniref:ASCH domain-containing protein n=1 Tax=Actinoplanes sichuanensis TaxID=512349 RepID=A0ABW4A7Q6_9ACTN|nr:hypothetical protein [Actinoplanes sichuanensis]BEL07817.1 hypothetical protein Q0Z83_060080 [Actinoplanes sichuanensis]
MTTFPLPLEEGLVLAGHMSKSAARNTARTWLITVRGLSEDDADDAVDGVTVAQGALWSDEPDGNGFAPAGFVMSPDYPGATPVTVVHLARPLLVED